MVRQSFHLRKLDELLTKNQEGISFKRRRREKESYLFDRLTKARLSDI